MVDATKTTARLAVGDIVVWVHPNGEKVTRQITEVRDTGYQWRYPDQEAITAGGYENSFMSEDSNDPFFQWGWMKGTESYG